MDRAFWKFLEMHVFYINICSFISRDKSLYEIWVLHNTYLCFKVQRPTSDSKEITAGGPINTLENPVTPDDHQWKKIYRKQVHDHI